jgi:ABC-type Mn2+/Zn2+ transport system ATPase subunit
MDGTPDRRTGDRVATAVSDDWLLRLRGVAAGYRGRAVLQDVDFTLQRGSFTALLGANGSGKSTLLKTILGLLPPIQGRVEFPPTSSPAIGYVPQQEQLDANYPITAFDVVLMGGYGRLTNGLAVPGHERLLAHECLESTGVADLSNRRFAQLSGGQRQRVLISRALITKPAILILDEPTAGIDVTATASFLELLAGIHRERRLTVLLVTHDFGIVRRHASRVAWLRSGRLTEGETASLMTTERIAEMLELT